LWGELSEKDEDKKKIGNENVNKQGKSTMGEKN
jgi:hypothetical protein